MQTRVQLNTQIQKHVFTQHSAHLLAMTMKRVRLVLQLGELPPLHYLDVHCDFEMYTKLVYDAGVRLYAYKCFEMPQQDI